MRIRPKRRSVHGWLPTRRRFAFEPLESRDLLNGSVAVDIPDDLVAPAGAVVSVPVYITDAAGLQGAEVHVSYPADLLEVQEADVRAGAVWPAVNTSVFATVDATAGTVAAWAWNVVPMESGSGSLLTIDFTVKSSVPAGTVVAIDLVNVRLNEDGIAVDPAPQAGVDPSGPPSATDGFITVIDENHAPHGADNTVTTLEDMAHTFAAAEFGFSDPDDSPSHALLAVKITTLPLVGALTNDGAAVHAGDFVPVSDISAGRLQYMPAAHANGVGLASFAFQVQDDGGTANGGVDLDPTARTMQVDVIAVNDAPTAADQAVTTAEDTAIAITLGASDVETAAGQLVFQITAAPQHGILGPVTGNQVVYTPNVNYNGPDSFQFTVTDDGDPAGSHANPGDLTSAPAVVSLTVTPVNDRPAADAQAPSTAEDTAVVIFLGAGDVETAAVQLVFQITTAPQHGILGPVTGNQVVYTPNANYSGPDSFQFTVTDNGDPAGSHANPGNLTSEPATVSLTVTPVNDRPAAQSQSPSTVEDTAVTITLDASDVETAVANLRFDITVPPQHGTLGAIAGNQVVYTPDANYSGPDSFQFTVTDDGDPAGSHANPGALTSEPATVSLTVTPVNDRPAAQSQSASTAEDTAVTITLGASDVETAAANLRFDITVPPQHGTLGAIAGNQVVYTPDANYSGPDSFQFTVTDSGDPAGSHANPGDLASEPATVAITVTPVNDRPTANAQSLSTNEDAAITITLSGSDVETPPGELIIQVTGGPQHGILSGVVSNRVVYTPGANFSGSDTFYFVVLDGGGLMSLPAAVTIVVTPVNDRPTAESQAVPVTQDTPVTISLIGNDLETAAAELIYQITALPQHGTLGPVSGGRVTYTPSPGYIGADSFQFTVTDNGDPAGSHAHPGDATSAAATISLTVTPAPATGSLSGFVYVDANNDGNRAIDGVRMHAGIGGVTIRLRSLGMNERVCVTRTDGSYRFDNLPAGTYEIVEEQPPKYLDGLETAGTLGGVAGDDVFTGVVLAAGVSGTEYNFGERGLRAEYVNEALSLSSTLPADQLVNRYSDTVVYGVADTVGLYDPASSMFHLRNTNTWGAADAVVGYGPAGAGWLPLAGDWDGDGIDTVALYDPVSSTFHLRNSNTTGVAEITFGYGRPGAGWLPLAGDWNGDGVDTVALYDPAASEFYLRNSNTVGVADLTFGYGRAGAGWKPMVGDWNADAVDSVALYDPAARVFYLAQGNRAGTADSTLVLSGVPSGQPAAGDWNGEGTASVGVYEPGESSYYLAKENTPATPVIPVRYGPAPSSWLTVVGRWTDHGGWSSLLAAEGEAAPVVAAPSLAADALASIVDAAIARWAAAGASADVLAAMRGTSVGLADLPGAELGRAYARKIVLDGDAAGHGWFVDRTPTADEEFWARQAIRAEAVDHIDLESVVLHELGHIAGLADMSESESVMGDVIASGVRRTPTADDLLR